MKLSRSRTIRSRNIKSGRSARRPPVALRRRALFLERLEERTLLATIVWDGEAGDNAWGSAANWFDETNDVNNVLPSSGDDVEIRAPFAGQVISLVLGAGGTTVSINSLQSAAGLHIQSGSHAPTSLLIASTAQLDGPVSLVSGSFGGGGTLTINDRLIWTGGSLAGGGTLVVAPGATLAFDSAGSLFSSGSWTIENQGTIDWIRGGLNNSDPMTINNRSGALFNVRNGGNLGSGNSGRIFNNEGTLRKSEGTVRSAIQMVFNNTGSVEVASGTLALVKGGVSNGDFNFAAGTTLELRGGDDFFQNTHAITLGAADSIVGEGRLLVPYKTVVIQGTGLVDIPTLEINGTRAQLNLNLDVAIPNVTLATGTGGLGGLGGTGTLTVTDRLNWTGGSMLGGGTTHIAPGATLTINATNVDIQSGGRTIDNFGTIDWVGGNINASGSARLTFNNRAGGLLDIRTNGTAGATGSVLNNSGTVRKSAGTGRTEFAMVLNSTNLVEVQAGTLAFTRGGVSSGNFLLDAGTTLELVGSQPGFFTSSHTITLGPADRLAGQGRLLVGAEKIILQGSGLVAPGILEVGGSSFAGLELNTDASIPNVIVASGRLGGTGTLTVTETMNWTGGAMAGAGTTRIAAAATLTIDPATTVGINDGVSATSPMRTLDNFGTINWLRSDIFIADPLVLRNRAGALLEIRGDATLGHQGSLINDGTLRKSAGTGLSRINMSVTGGGVYDVQRGELRLEQGLRVDGSGIVAGQPRGTLTVTGNLVGNSQNADQFAAGSQVRFQGGSSGSPRLLEVMSQDRGPTAGGFIDNFLYERLALAGAFVRLVDQADNAGGSEPEALYVNNLIVPSGNTLDLNGLAVYTRAAQINGTILNGTVTLVGDGGGLPLNQMTPGTIATAGEVDEWTFFGRAGDVVSVVATTGGTAFNAPVAPQLGFVHVDVLDPSGAVLASQSTTSSGVALELLGLSLAAEGVYRVRVRTPDAQPTLTGNYQIGVFDATIDAAPLVFNQTHFGGHETQYSTDRWTFSAAAGQQVKFDLLNTTSSGTRFSLTGPSGLVIFAGASGDSALVTLPTAGQYVLEATEVQGNSPTAYAFRLDATLVTDLLPNTTYAGALAGSGHTQLFRLPLAAAERFRIDLDDAASDNRNELYVKFGAPPTRSDFHYRFDSFASADQQIVVDNALAGDWYVLLYSAATPTPSAFTITATTGEILLDAVSPSQHGNSAPATLTLTGAGFTAATTVALVDGGGMAFPASAVSLDQPTQIRATFAAASVPLGAYTVRVENPGGGSAELSGAFQVLSGGQANLETNLVLPSAVGRHALATIYIEYANTGTVAMPAPLLVLSATDRALLTLDQTRVTQGFWTSAQPDGFSDTVHIFTPGVLQPGESLRVPVYYTGLLQPWNFDDEEVAFDLTVTTEDSTETIDWDAIRDAARPPHVAADVWQRLWSHFAAETGSTWGDYVRMINANAAYLGLLGQHVADAAQLFNFALYQLGEMSPQPQFFEGTDAEVPTPGLALRLGRSFATTLLGRHRLGMFGRGWGHTWESSAQRLADGTAVIEMGGIQRRFQPDSRNNGYFAENGDASTLTRGPGNELLLREADGLQIAYHADGRLDYVRDTNGNRITASYAAGRLSGLSHSAGQSLTLSYNAAGRVEQVTDSLGRQTLYTYDATGEQLVEVQYADGRVARYAYDTNPASAAYRALLSAEVGGGAGRFLTYDARGRLAGLHRAGGAEAVTIGYPGQGRVVLTNAGAASELFFDLRGQVARSINPLGASEFFERDQDLNLVRTVDPLGRVQQSGFDPLRNVTSRVDALGDTLAFGYGSLSRLTSAIDSRGNLTTYARDGGGNLATTAYADGSLERRGHDAAGNVVRLINRRLAPIDLAYNASGQLTQKTFSDDSSIDYAYDARGNLASVTDASGVTTLAYDAGDRLTRVTYPGGRFVAYAYDAAGRRTRLEDSAGNIVNYSYDAGGRLARLSDDLDDTIAAYSYDAAGRVARQDQGNGTFTTYDYDAAGRVVLLVNHAPGGGVQSRFEYSYDLSGRRIRMGALDGEWTYSYDAADRLTRAVFASTNPAIADQDLQYAYDAMGNRTSTIAGGVTTLYAANNLNQYTQVGPVNQSFDADGNLVSRDDGSGVTTYQYDDENRLVAVASPAGVWTYEYDALGNRQAVVHNGQRTEYLVDPTGIGNVIGEYDAGGNPVGSYLFGLGLVSRIDAAGAAAYFQFDALGSTVGVLDAAGNALNSYHYLPFGETLAATESVPNPFTYVGATGVLTDDNGLLHMRHRFYDPEIGAFISQDPLRLPADHLYAYVSNNPISLIDPEGLRGYAGLCYVEGDGMVPCSGPDGERADAPDPIPPGTDAFDLIDQAINSDCAGRNVMNGLNTVTGRGDIVIEQEERRRRGGGDGGGPCSGGGAVPPPPPGGPGGGGSGGIVGSQDPNEKIGPAGEGALKHVRPGSLLPYRINFENVETATAPAQQVEITDQLDSALDWNTLEITSVGFGDVFIPVPPGSQYFSTTVSTEFNGQTFDVHIEVAFDTLTGLLVARFQSIDPATMLPPDVLTGFLPPEDGTGRGQGHISYAVRAQTDLATGDTTQNIALITFDSQQTIATNQVDPLDPSQGTDPALEARNTIDADPPASSVDPLPAESLTESFTVSWSGADDAGGSGIGSFDVFVSEDGGPFVPLLTGTTETSTLFTGQVGRTYGFYSVARDLVGFVQSTPAAAQATTTIAAAVPTAEAGGPYTVAEAGAVMLTGIGSDPLDDPATLVFAWDLDGDGTFETSGASPTFSAAALDGPASITVTLRVTNSSGNSSIDTATIDVLNVPPTAHAGGPSTGTAGTAVVLDASASSDPIDAPLSFAWDLDDDGQFDDATGAVVSFTSPDAGVHPVAVQVSDGDGASDVAATTVTLDSAPQTDVDLQVNGPAVGVRGQPLEFVFTVEPAGQYRYEIDWDGDGAVDQVREAGQSLSLIHIYPDTGRYGISATVGTLDGSASAAAAHEIDVHAVALIDGQLLVGGTSGHDKIQFSQQKKKKEQQVFVSIGKSKFGPFHAAEVSQLIAFGQEGNDKIIVPASVRKPSVLYGGDGNDMLIGGPERSFLAGGNGNDLLLGGKLHDILLGGEGNDMLGGGSGRDLLIGGLGGDKLLGGSHADVLIGGTTAHDDNDAALLAILGEWTSGRAYSERIANLREGLGPILAATGTKLKKDQTVFDDFDRDQLTGGCDLDWFLFDSSRDRLHGKHRREIAE